MTTFDEIKEPIAELKKWAEQFTSERDQVFQREVRLDMSETKKTAGMQIERAVSLIKELSSLIQK